MNRAPFWMKLLLALAVIIIAVPLCMLVLRCFVERWAFPELLPQVWSLRGVEAVLGAELGSVIFSSVFISLAVALLALLISLPAARAFALYDFPGKSAVEFLSLAPIVVPATVFGMGIHVVTIYLHLTNTMAGVILVHLVCCLPYSIKILTDMTRLLGPSLEQQAQVLGASPAAAFRQVTLPALAPGLASSACMVFIVSYSQYFLTLLIGGGQIKTFSIVMVPFIQSGDRTIASCYSVLFIATTFIVFLILDGLRKRVMKNRRTDLIN